MRKVDAMEYEYLIRRAFSCGRTHEHGADASVYRKLEMNHFAINTGSKASDDDEYNYRSSIAEVSGNIREAIMKVQETYSHEELKELCEKIVFMPSKDEIDEVIIRTSGIFMKLNLKEGR